MSIEIDFDLAHFSVVIMFWLLMSALTSLIQLEVYKIGEYKLRYLQLCRSEQFERICDEQCGQSGSFALITTEYPWQTEDRLNGGWQYWKGPRKGTRSPPLAYCTDWKVEKTWIIGFLNRLITQNPEFWTLFDHPCVVFSIERRLMADDNQLFKDLRAKDMSKNSLECVACLKRQNYPQRSDSDYESEEKYQSVLTLIIVNRLRALFDVLGLNVSESPTETEDHKAEKGGEKQISILDTVIDS